MRILCLDQGAYTGWCHGIIGAMPNMGPGSNLPPPVHGVQRLPASLTGPKRAKALYRFLTALVRDNEIEKIYFEEPILPKVTSFVTVYGLMGLATAIGWVADDFGIACAAIRMQTWRSEFGVATRAPKKLKGTEARRKWLKQQSIDRCNALGFNVTDDNEAEGCGMFVAMSQRAIRRESQTSMDFSANLSI